MSEDRSRRADELFEAALELSPGARDAWLAEEAGEDPELLREVEELLEAHAMGGGILDGEPPGRAADAWAGDAGARVRDGAAGSRTERRIGPYRVLRELGRGGMGVVYLAERDDGQYRRRVAIKLLRAGPDAEELRRRFRAERQILASLHHPHIAQLLDGGVTDGQLPYLVMEYVEGLPITRYCERHRLGLGERLELFRDVCGAVHHAHRNLVIHRDLKPSNILVTRDRQVKLLDFGIAKLLNPGISAMDLPLTRTEFRVMTPEYASPEQVRGEPLSTASDVYALGVVLYELLTGRRPHELATGSPGELADAVREVEPERPSVAVTGDPERAPPQAEALRRELRGDLDAIVMMALRKEPNGRYGSADLLAADLQRYTDGLPVVAHKGSRRYRARKFLRRHRAQVAAAGIVALSLIGGAGAALWQASVATAERDRARAARAEAERAAAESEEVATFLTSLFEASDPEESLGDTITARELLARGLERTDQLDAQPLVQARMLEVIGRVYRHLGEYDRARPLVARSLELRRTHAGPDSLEVVPSLVELGELDLAVSAYEAADGRLRHAVELLRRAPSPEPVRLAGALGTLALARHQLGDYRGAEALYLEALELERDAWGEESEEVARTTGRLASALHARGEYDRAEEILRETLAVRLGLFGETHPEVAGNLIQLAGVHAARDGDWVAAEELHRRALEIRRRVYGEEHPEVARSLGYVAGTLGFQGRDAEAEPLLRQALSMNRRLLGPRHRNVAGSANSLALLALRTGRVDEAERLFREAISIYREAHGPEHHVVASVIGNLGRVDLARGDLDGAEAHFRRALEIRVASLGGEHPFTLASRRSLADVLERKRAFSEAEAVWRDVLAIYEARSDGAERVREVHRELSELYRAWGRAEDARRHESLVTASEDPPAP